MPVTLRLDRILKETRAMVNMVGPFTDDAGPLTQLLQQITSLSQSKKIKSGIWSIGESYPLKTKASKNYSSRGETDIWAEITSKWEVERVANAAEISIAGIASTKVVLHSQSQPVAMWRMEIGNPGHPGALHHVQVFGQQVDGLDLDGVHPAWLEVPRLPFFVATPAASIEYVLSELFQSEWTRNAIQDERSAVISWNSVQQERWREFLNWQLKQAGSQGFSPLVRLKEAGTDLKGPRVTL